jgi:hypothetical protein
MAISVSPTAASSTVGAADGAPVIVLTEETDKSRYEATPEEALAAIECHAGPVLVDLDETLYLRNSISLGPESWH